LSALADRAGTIELADGGRLAFEVHGAHDGAVPVLLLRPLVGAMALWGDFGDALAARLPVIAFDPRGTGASSDAPVEATTRDLARDAVALLDALGVPVAHVFGISFGAMIATWIAVDAPARVARLCLASAGPVGFALTASGLGRALVMTATALVPGDAAAVRLVGEVLSRDVRDDDPARVAEVESVAAAAPADRVELLKHALAAARHDARAELHRVVARTLVLTGDRDELIGEAPSAALAAGIPKARREVIVGAGHDLTLERPAETAARVADFLLARD
jgi:3-oxoadipate enol-lactonase/4-carboxymuconolactone decarboxylase